MDVLGLNRILRFKVLSALLAAGMVLTFFSASASGYYDKKALNIKAYSATELQSLIEEYGIQARDLDQQIKDVQKDLNWLVLKINRIADDGRHVPQALKASVKSKEKKINHLKKQKLRLDNILARYGKAYAAQKAASRPAAIKSSSIPPQARTAIKEPDESAVQGKISDIERAVRKAGLDDWLVVMDADGGCAKINNALPILFSSGSAALAKEYKAFLKKLAIFLKPYDVKVYVNGFADPDPIHTKRYPSNFELGASRAANVVHEMVRYGLKPEIFKIGTTGEYRFAAKKTSSQKSFQRRAQLTVVFSS